MNNTHPTPKHSARWWMMCLTLMLCAATRAQDKFEYFWNTDPGMGNGSMVAAAGGEATFTLSTEALGYGVHLLGIRAISEHNEEDRDIYSPTMWYTLVKADPTISRVTKVEYFWNTDPGAGNGTAVDAAGGEATFMLSTEELGYGVHLLGIRAMSEEDGSGEEYYSPTMWYTLVKVDPTISRVTKVEYFWDTDPGAGNGTAVNAVGGEAVFTLPTEGLDYGVHLLGIRAMSEEDGSGEEYYSPTVWYTLLKTDPTINHITKMEYFWDTDPGMGNGTQQAIVEADGGAMVHMEIPTDALGDGLHLLGMRFATGDQWSGTAWYYVVVSDDEVVTIERIEGYWDEDPGYGLGFELPFTGQSPSVVDAVEIDAPTDYGTHILYIRALASNGVWSATYMYELCMNADPQIDFSNDTVCVGEQFIVYNKTAGATQETTYSWDMDGDGKEDSQASGAFVYSYAKAGTYLASLSVKTVGDCATTCYVPIVVLPTDAPKVTLAASSKTMCEGSAIRLQATATNAGDHPEYEWLVNDEVVAVTTVDTLMISDLYDNDKVQVRVISSNPCAAVDNALSSQITIRVTPLPEVSIAHYFPLYTSEKDVILKGGTPEGGTYYVDGAETQLFQISSYEVGNYRLSYVYTNNNGCTNEAVTTLQLREPGASSLQLGDVNKDETIDVMDVLCEVDLIYGRMFPTYTLTTADINGDKQVNVVDVVGVSGIILGDRAAAKARAAQSRVQQRISAVNALTSADVHAVKTTEVMMRFDLSAAKAVSGVQFDVTMPEGVELTSATKGLVVGRKAGAEDNTYTLLAYSMSLDAVPGTLAVKATLPANMSEGVYVIAPENVVLVDASMNMLSCNTASSKLFVGATTGMAQLDGNIQVTVEADGLHIVNAAGKVAMITDAAGRLVLVEELADADCLISLSALPAGTYVVEIIDEYSPVKVKFLWK